MSKPLSRSDRRTAAASEPVKSSNRRIMALAGLVAVMLAAGIYFQWIPLLGGGSDELLNKEIVFSETFAGDGPRNSHLFALNAGATRIEYDVPAEGTTAIRLVDMAGNAIESVQSGNGQRSGSKIVRIPAKASYALAVQSSGPWRITITQ